jgi:integrase
MLLRADRVFNVPASPIRILDPDLKVAGIEKRDEFGRTIDVHALRHSFGTLLSTGGVAPGTTQAAMRHSPLMTMIVCTDPRLLDLRGALERLPDLPLTSEPS